MPKSAGNSNVEKLQTGEAKLLILLVGINQYDDAKINNLNYCVNDCQELKSAIELATQIFPDKNIIVHHDYAPELPIFDVVRNSLEKLITQATQEDTILIYFSGHGFLDKQTQQPILCLKNTQTNNLATTGLPVAEMLQKLAESGAKYQLIFIDACHSGGTSINFQHLSQSRKLSEPKTSSIAPQLIELFWQKAAKSKGFYALLSCDKYEQSREWKVFKHGLFTYYLIQGFLGNAADNSGLIEADSLYKYVYNRTLEYIDKTNQQIRLTNQQKSHRGESNIESEYPGQTPLRIVEGAGEFVLGIVPINSYENSRRQALIVNGLAGCEETVSLSGVLHSRGDFTVGYWPRTDSSWQRVKDGILECLNIDPPHPSPSSPSPHTSHTPHTQLETTFLYIRGEVETIINNDDEQEHYLVLGDGVRISCFWLQRKLWNSLVRQQVIILDFPNAENDLLTQWVEYLHQEKNKSQCIIASSSLQFSQELVKILGNAQHGLTVAGLVIELQQRLKITTYLSGNAIDILLPGEATNTIFDANICPYKGLEAFRQQDAEFFFGRQKLTQEILANLRDSSFLAVVGASGSGKSSVVQAGVLPKLAAGKQPPGKCLCCCFRPSDFLSGKTDKTEKTPINALAQVLATDGKVAEMEGLLHFGVEGLVLWLRRRVEPMVVLVVDQFEELFTLSGEKERLEFLNLLLGALRETSDKLRLIITLRDDFIGNCLEVPELEVLVQENLMLVSPNLQEEEYRDAIVKPAEKVGLKVESGLVDVLLDGVQEELGGLPLLQFVLRELWEKRRDGMLSLQVYQEEIGGFKEVLENKAEDVRRGLHGEEESCAQFIFLELVQLGEEGKDTRRRVLKSELLGKKYGKDVMESVLKKLSDARLIVVGGKVESGEKGENVEENVAESVEENLEELEITVEVAHEILIRHWSTLRWWLDKNRSRLQQQRQMEQDAKKWVQHGRVDDFLLRGVALQNAEELYIKYGDELSELTQEFIEAGMALRQRQEEEKRLGRRRMILGLMGGLVAVSVFAVGAVWQWRRAVIQEEKALIGETNANLRAEIATLKAGLNSSLEVQMDVIELNRKIQQTKTATSALRIQGADLLRRIVDWQGEKEINSLEGHQERVVGVAFSPQGDLIASASHDNTVKLWKPDGSLMTTLIGHQRLVTSVAFSPKGDLIASASADKTVKLWKPDGTLVNTFKGQYVSAVAFSPQGDLIASASGDKTVKLWKPDGTLVNTLKGHQEYISAIAFSPKGDLIVSGSWDRTVKLWKLDGTLVNTLKGHQEYVSAVAFSPQGDLIASASGDKTVKLWKPDGTLVNTLKGHQGYVSAVAFSPKGDLIASASLDNTVKLWKPDGSLVTTLTHNHGIFGVAFSPKGDLIASASWNKTVKLWKLDGTLINTLKGHQEYISAIAFSPKGDLIVSGSWDRTVKLWKLDGTLVNTLKGHQEYVSAVAFSPKGDLIASASDDKTVKLWKLDGTLVNTLKGHQRPVYLAFNPSGDLIASASWNNSVKLWKPDGTLVTTFTGKDNINGIAFSPKGDLIALADGDGTVTLWKLDGSLVTTLIGHQNTLSAVAFSPDGNLIASASNDKTVKLWKPDGTLVTTLIGHQNPVTDVAFSPNGNLIASASLDKTVKLWKLDGSLVTTLTGHQDSVSAIAFSPNGDFIASASGDKTVKLWNFNRDGLIYRACKWMSNYLKNNPNLEEKERHLCGEIEPSATAFFLKGEKLAADGKLDEAVSLFQQAVKLDPNLSLNLAAASLLRTGRELIIENQKVELAISMFRQAQILQPDIDINPDTKEKETNPEKVAKRFVALGKVTEGTIFAIEGKIESAISLYNEAQKLDSDVVITAWNWNLLCWNGSLHNQAQNVMFACEKAVQLSPNNSRIINSRGLARALTGDFPGAISDFQAFVEWTTNDKHKAKRQGWINSLKKGENPFTSEVLEDLLNE